MLISHTSVVSGRKEKIRILVMDNQVLMPPESGGPLRIVNLFGSLPSNYEVNYLGVTGWQHYQTKVRNVRNKLYEKIIPLSKPFLHVNNFFTNILKSIPTFDAVCATCMPLSRNFIKEMKNEIKRSDIIVSSHPWFFNYIKNYKNKITVYDSHNCEYLLYKKYFKDNFSNKLFEKTVKKLEKDAYKKSDIMLACSIEDAKNFIKTFGRRKDKMYVIPNPLDTEEFKLTSKEEKIKAKKALGLTGKKTLVFVGNYYLPNIEALKFILNGLVPNMKDFTFLIIGSIDKYYYEGVDENLKNMVLKKIDIKNRGIFGYGWFDLEFWGDEGFGVRWTKKSFNFIIKDKAVDMIRIKYRSRRSMKGSIFINGKKIIGKKFFASNFRHYTFKIDKIDYVNCEFKIDNNKKTLFSDTRDTALAITAIEYRSQKKWKMIPIDETIGPLVVPKNVRLYGKVRTEKMKQIYQATDIAMNPVFSGSGLNIKMLDYFATGIPTVTTPVGRRGLKARHNQDLLVCSPKNFEKGIRRLSKDKQLQEKFIKNGRKIVEDYYSNEVVGKQVSKIFEKYLDEFKAKKK